MRRVEIRKGKIDPKDLNLGHAFEEMKGAVISRLVYRIRCRQKNLAGEIEASEQSKKVMK